ncbi:helix-turn-helix domain-containing protein [Pseudomonas sp. PDM25]|uniref:helix-turn-helix domain-containing protein n=1 Tax=Pseudomonas sp. PDM25 TaxID=2854772 RepID=UPI001C43EE28|nr:helix-turn-helix domain-containing protein [Pseudomonas sp. PDM25]MBV7515691.1 helix-turn-helix domain-containing protein [Pseudomonas sp. PDM25]
MATIEVFCSSRMVEPSLQSDYWREITRPVFDICRPHASPHATIEGELFSRSNGELLIGRTEFSAQRFSRSSQKIQRTGVDGYVLQLMIAGNMRGDVGERRVQLCPGDIYILDLGRICDNHTSSGARLTMMIERGRVEQLVGRADLHGMIFRRGQSINQLLTDFLTALWKLSLDLSYADSVVAVNVVSRLVKAGLGDHTPLPPDEWGLALATLRLNIFRHIDAHLVQPDLGVESILTRFGISRATLYRAFENDGGVVTVIRERRLNAARDLLARSDGQLISQVAFRFGFASQSQFFKAFRHQFGFSPSDAIAIEPSNDIAPNISELAFHFSENSFKKR